MKFRTIALAICSIASTYANAHVAVDDASTVSIYMRGSSALRQAVYGVVLNDICGGRSSGTASNNITTYNAWEGSLSNGVATFDRTSLSVAFNGNYWAITCDIPNSNNPNPSGLPPGTHLAFYKTDAGGSAEGVFPVYNASNGAYVDPTAFNPSHCVEVKPSSTSTDEVYNGCKPDRNKAVTLGISDVEPGMFTGINVPNDPDDPAVAGYPPTGLTNTQINNAATGLVVTPVVQTVFAVAVNTALYNAMFTKQGLSGKKDKNGNTCDPASTDPINTTDPNCIPSIGYSQARSFFAGAEANWRVLVGSSDPLINSQVNICRRVQGSGTQASANLVLNQYPCSTNALTPADWTYSSSDSPEATSSVLGGLMHDHIRTYAQYLIDNMGHNSGNGPMPTGTMLVYEGSGTGDVINCLNAAQKAQGYAIGHVSRENSPGSNSYKFVKLEGANPTRDDAKVGQYDYLVESTIQYKRSTYNALSDQQKTFVTNLTSQMAMSSALVQLPGNNQNGVLVLPTAYSGDFDSLNPLSNDAKFGSRVSRGGLSCNPLVTVK